MPNRDLARVAVVGAGPGGLFLATLLRRQLPALTVTVFERNRRTDAFGFGVVFSDATLRTIDEADPVLRDALATHGRHWTRIDVWSQDERHSFDGNGMAAIHRKVLLGELQAGADAAGVDLRFGAEAPPLEVLERDFDLVIGADGTNSGVRRELEARADLGHHVDEAGAKFIWFGVEHLFPGLTFLHKASEHGNFAVHGYPISDELSTFIVETDEATWRAAGLDGFDVSQSAGRSDAFSQKYLEELFADQINGARLVANNSRWGNFRTRRTRQWYHDRVVLLGDAVHTAHFSVGSGTKMAMEDAVVLADQLGGADRGDRSTGGVPADPRGVGRQDPPGRRSEPVLVGALRLLPASAGPLDLLLPLLLPKHRHRTDRPAGPGAGRSRPCGMARESRRDRSGLGCRGPHGRRRRRTVGTRPATDQRSDAGDGPGDRCRRDLGDPSGGHGARTRGRHPARVRRTPWQGCRCRRRRRGVDESPIGRRGPVAAWSGRCGQ
jgi:2-polyprenyl-6-methoxyphenol hydroxylase-like FAD-dependent oxidoreductase